MPPQSLYRELVVHSWAVPRPFRAFAVRSEERRHAYAARAPYGRIHCVRAKVDAASLRSLGAEAWARLPSPSFTDVEYAATSIEDLCATATGTPDLVGSLAEALHRTQVLGEDLAGCRQALLARVDYLGCRGAGFHNDVRGHGSRSLFWLLALDLADVQLVLPHAGLAVPLAPGDLVVFDPSLAHGLCRPGDEGQAVEASFLDGSHDHQVFLTGELPLADGRWEALGCPWLPVEEHERRGALDLLVAEFDERTGVVKRPASLLHCMQRSTCYVDE